MSLAAPTHSPRCLCLQVRDRDEESEDTCVTGQRLSYDGCLSSRSLTKQRSLELALSVFSLEL